MDGKSSFPFNDSFSAELLIKCWSVWGKDLSQQDMPNLWIPKWLHACYYVFCLLSPPFQLLVRMCKSSLPASSAMCWRLENRVITLIINTSDLCWCFPLDWLQLWLHADELSTYSLDDRIWSWPLRISHWKQGDPKERTKESCEIRRTGSQFWPWRSLAVSEGREAVSIWCQVKTGKCYYLPMWPHIGALQVQTVLDVHTR